MSRLEELISSSRTDTKTLLLVDETDTEKSLHYIQNSANFVILDVDKLHMKRTVQKMKLPLLLEEARFLLVFAMKYGKTLVVRFGNSCADLCHTYCDECCEDLEKQSKIPPFAPQSFLPSCFLQQSGAVVRSEEYVARLFRRDDVHELEDDDLPVQCHENFRVMVTSALTIEKLDDSLFNGKFGLPGSKEWFNIQQYRGEDSA